jgi:hypothetical protein
VRKATRSGGPHTRLSRGCGIATLSLRTPGERAENAENSGRGHSAHACRLRPKSRRYVSRATLSTQFGQRLSCQGVVRLLSEQLAQHRFGLVDVVLHYVDLR